jgi:hypothetical protein
VDRDSLKGISMEQLVEDPRFGGLPLSGPQRALLRLADGKDIDCLDAFGVRKHLGGNGSVFKVPRRPKTVIARSGRRSGKSLLAAFVALLFCALFCKFRRPPKPHEVPGPDGLVGVRPGEFVRGVIVTPRKQQSRAAFRHLVGAMRNSPTLKQFLVSDNTESIVIRRPDGNEVTIEILAASPLGTNLRGSWFVGAIFDEADFFNERDASINLLEQRDAVMPALCEGGQVWIISSPWADNGPFHDMFTEAFGNPGSTVAFHSDSMSMNPTLDRAEVEEMRAKDPDFVAREYDAIPMASSGNAWFPKAAIVAACTRSERTLKPDDRPHWGGCDLGFRKNSSAVAFAKSSGTRVVLSFYNELIPTKEVPLKPSVVCSEFAKAALMYRCHSIMGDGIYRASAEDELPKTVGPGGQTVSYECWSTTEEAAAFTEFRRLMVEGLIELPNDPRLIQQLKDTKIRKLASGKIGPLVPNTGAAHGDLLMAIVLACVQVPVDGGTEHEMSSSLGDDAGAFTWGDDRGFG